jgi:uncharacterized protein
MRKPRVEVLDTLRALALLGVIAVNSASFVYGGNSPVAGAVDPADSVFAALVHGLVVALFQNKAYPLLAFLLGYGIALQLRNATPHAIARRKRVAFTLAALGLAHGFFVYFGDILLAYGVASLILIRVARTRLRKLVRLWKWLAVYVVIVALLYGFAGEQALQPVLRDTAVWSDLLMLNASLYGWSLVGMPFDLLQVVLLFGIAGLVAARLRWLEDARRWRKHWAWLAHTLLPWALALNIATGALCAWYALADNYTFLLQQTLPMLLGPLLTAGLLGWVALALQRGNAWLHAITPVGRYTLSMYLCTSLVLLLTLPVAGLGLSQHIGTAGTFAFSLLIYAAWVALALLLARRGIAGPFERLLR